MDADLALDVLSLSDAAEAAAGVLHNDALLARIFCHAGDLETLLHSLSVCKLWRSVLESDDIWRAVYLALLPEPLEYERVPTYRQQFQRLHGLQRVPPPQQTALKGSALCYNAATSNLVSFHSRQRMVSVQRPDGSIRSEVTDVRGAATAHKPLLASTSSELVVLAAFDGPLQLWDASACQPAGVLGGHASFVTSLDASGSLVASTCSAELRLWRLESRQCLFQVPIGLPMPSPVLEPHVALCARQQLLALANCAAPMPSSVVKVYSTRPAGRTDSSAARPAALTPGTQQQQQPPAGSVTVGSSSAPDAAGAVLLRELPVNAAADMLLLPGLLLVASCFHGRAVSSNTPYKSERPFTVVVHIWDTDTWQLTRLVSPRLWTDYPIYTMQGMPLISLSQGMLLCATLRSGITRPTPSCCIHAWQLPRSLLLSQRTRQQQQRLDGSAAAHAAAGGGTAAGSSSSSSRSGPVGGGGGVCKLSVSPSKHGSMAAAVVGGATSSSAGGSSSSSSSRAPEAFGEGAVALGRSAVAVAGGSGQVGVSSSNTVMLAVSDTERDAWQLLVEDTEGRLAVMLTTPTHLVLATDLERVLSSPLLPAAAVETGDPCSAPAAVGAEGGDVLQQQQQQQPGEVQQAEVGGQQVQQQGPAPVAAAALDSDGRFIHIDA